MLIRAILLYKGVGLSYTLREDEHGLFAMAGVIFP